MSLSTCRVRAAAAIRPRPAIEGRFSTNCCGAELIGAGDHGGLVPRLRGDDALAAAFPVRVKPL